jgi:hypothetical protein
LCGYCVAGGPAPTGQWWLGHSNNPNAQGAKAADLLDVNATRDKMDDEAASPSKDDEAAAHPHLSLKWQAKLRARKLRLTAAIKAKLKPADVDMAAPEVAPTRAKSKTMQKIHGELNALTANQ